MSDCCASRRTCSWGCITRRGAAHLRDGSNADLVHNLRRQIIEPAGEPHARLGHKVHRAQLQRFHGDLRATLGQCGDHHHRRGPQAHESPQKIDAIHARHLDVQGDDIRIQFANHLARHQGVIGGTNALHVPLAIDDL